MDKSKMRPTFEQVQEALANLKNVDNINKGYPVYEKIINEDDMYIYTLLVYMTSIDNHLTLGMKIQKTFQPSKNPNPEQHWADQLYFKHIEF